MEEVFLLVLGLDEAETAVRNDPLDGTGGHHGPPSCSRTHLLAQVRSREGDHTSIAARGGEEPPYHGTTRPSRTGVAGFGEPQLVFSTMWNFSTPFIPHGERTCRRDEHANDPWRPGQPASRRRLRGGDRHCRARRVSSGGEQPGVGQRGTCAGLSLSVGGGGPQHARRLRW